MKPIKEMKPVMKEGKDSSQSTTMYIYGGNHKDAVGTKNTPHSGQMKNTGYSPDGHKDK